MTEKYYDFVFENMTVADWAKADKAIQEAKKGNIHEMLQFVDSRLAGTSIDEIPFEEISNLLEQFNEQLLQYFKLVNSIIRGDET